MLILNRVAPTDPFTAMQKEFNQMFNSLWANSSPFNVFPTTTTAFLPPINVWETEESYYVEAELPGFTMEELDVTVLGDEVTIKGERKAQTPEGAAYLRRERRAGSFCRSWTFPAEINSEGVQATLKDGVLLVTLPKAESSLPRKIQVKHASK
jgi:HSP20 family protein